MSWYYYSGNIVRSIPQTRTKSVAARPNTKVEILEVTQEVQALINQGVLRRTGRPAGAVSLGELPPRPVIRMADVVPKSGLAQHFAEKGVTVSKDLPPQKPVGKPEYTIHELAAVAPPDTADALPAADVAAEGSGKSKRRHGH